LVEPSAHGKSSFSSFFPVFGHGFLPPCYLGSSRLSGRLLNPATHCLAVFKPEDSHPTQFRIAEYLQIFRKCQRLIRVGCLQAIQEAARRLGISEANIDCVSAARCR
jgi:hypothetical protein